MAAIGSRTKWNSHVTHNINKTSIAIAATVTNRWIVSMHLICLVFGCKSSANLPFAESIESEIRALLSEIIMNEMNAFLNI